MLAHSPPLPLVIDYRDKDHDFTVEDEEGIVLALQCRDRVRRVRLFMSFPNMQKPIMAMDEEYPILEHLIMGHTTENTEQPYPTVYVLPELRAPNLRHLLLADFSIPIRSRLLMTAVGLVTLCLFMDISIQPNTLLQWVSFMPQLENLVIASSSPVPNRVVERQLDITPITQVTLPNLRWFSYQGVSASLEALVGAVIAPSLQQLRVDFFNQLTFPIPRLQQFINTTENLRFDIAGLKFADERVDVALYPRGAMTYAFGINVHCSHLDWQVSSMAQILNALRQVISEVEYLILEYESHTSSHEGHNEVDHTEWRELLKSFSHAKTLRIDDGIAKELKELLSCLQWDPLELLPELQELEYSGSGDLGYALTPFLDVRRNTGRPVILIDSKSNPFGSSMPSSYRSATI